MAKSATQLRALAADCTARAKHERPRRAAQLRECAQSFLRQARGLELFEHSTTVGRANVSITSFREYLRSQRA